MDLTEKIGAIALVIGLCLIAAGYAMKHGLL
jgi:hypothetical protein